MIEAGEHLARPTPGHAGEQFRLLDGQGPDDDPGDTPREQSRGRGLVPDSPTDLHRHAGAGRDLEHEVPVRRAAPAGGVEIDDVQA